MRTDRLADQVENFAAAKRLGLAFCFPLQFLHRAPKILNELTLRQNSIHVLVDLGEKRVALFRSNAERFQRSEHVIERDDGMAARGHLLLLDLLAALRLSH